MCPFGGLLACYLLDKFGRKRTMYFINFINIVAWLLMAFSSKKDDVFMFAQLMVARVILGLAIGLSSSPPSVYAAEISHPNLRGRLTLLTAFTTALGMLAIYILGYLIPNDFRMVCFICAGFTVLSFLVVIPIPESPSWLVGQDEIKRAKKSLKVVRQIADSQNLFIKHEIQTLINNVNKFKDYENSDSFFGIMRRPEVYKPFSIMVAFFAFQQFSGTFVILVYASKFSKSAGVNIDPSLCAVYIGLTRVLTTILMGYISDKYGRRPPAIFSGFGMAACMFGLVGCLMYPPTNSSFELLPAILLMAFVFSATLGFLTLPFSMTAELYPQKVRGLVASLTIFAGYTLAFIIIKLFPSMVRSFGTEVVFVVFGIVSVLGIGFVYLFLPETKGKTLDEIERYFRGPERVPQSDTETDISSSKFDIKL